MYDNQLENCVDINPDNDCNANKSISCVRIRHSWYNKKGCIKFIIRKNWDESKYIITTLLHVAGSESVNHVQWSKTFNGDVHVMSTLIYSQFLNAEMNVILRYRNAPHTQQKNTQKNTPKLQLLAAIWNASWMPFYLLTQENVWY